MTIDTKHGEMRAKLIRRLRRQMRGPMRWLKVEYVEAGVERHICQTCGHVRVIRVVDQIDERLAKKLTAYRSHGRGIQGTCSACTKTLRDERYPLSAGEKS